MSTRGEGSSERPGAARLSWALGLALAVSLGAHLLPRSARAPGERAGAEAAEAVPATSPAPGADPETARPRGAGGVSASPRRRAPRAASAPPAREASDAGTRAQRALAGSDERAQRLALCAKASRSLDESWQRDRDRIVSSLAQSLPDEAEQRRSLEQKLGQMRDVLELDGAARERLETAYQSAREERVREAVEGLQAEPPDLDAVFEAAKELFQDEDALIREAGGDAQLARWREAELESRTTILALLASLAGSEWDQELVW